MAWMTAEAAVAIAAGIIASSIAPVGFGLDSVIEFAAAAVVVWQLRGEAEDRETRAVRLIGVTFFALAADLAVPSIRDLVTQARAGQSVPGLAVTSAALVIMPTLPIAKHRTGGPGQPRTDRRRRRERLLRVHRGRRPAGRWPEYLAGLVAG